MSNEELEQALRAAGYHGPISEQEMDKLIEGSSSKMREKMIAALEVLRQREARERVKEMSEADLEAVIAADLKLPAGTTSTRGQLEMIAASERR